MHNSLFPGSLRTFDFFAGGEPLVRLAPLRSLFVVFLGFVVVVTLGSTAAASLSFALVSLGVALAIKSSSNPTISSFTPTATTREEEPSNPLTVQSQPAVIWVDGGVVILERGTTDTEFSSDHIIKQWSEEIHGKTLLVSIL